MSVFIETLLENNHLWLQWLIGSIVVYMLISFIKWLHFKWKRLQYFRKNGIPGPRPSFWFGNFPEYLQSPYLTLDRWCQKYGKYFGYYQGPMPILVLNDIEAIHECLVRSGRKFCNRQTQLINLEPFKSSLLNQRDKKWRHSRRILTPAFTVHKLSMKNTKDAINASVERLLASIERKSSSSSSSLSSSWPINITGHMQAVTLDVICRMAFNMTETDVHQDDSELKSMATKFMDDNSSPITQLAFYFPWFVKLVGVYYHSIGGGKFLSTIIEQLNNSIMEYYQKTMIEQLTTGQRPPDALDGPIDQSKVNLLDYMIEQKLQANLHETEVIGNSILIMLAGFETTATGLSYTLYLLAQHPDIQEQLRKELRDHRATGHNNDQGQPIDHCRFDQDRCELLDRVWFESLRLYPPVVTFVTRELGEEYEEFVLENLNLRITKEVCIQVPVWTLHHSPEHWPDPWKFDPFRPDLPIPGNDNKNPAFLAFGNGPRNCIGGNLAISEARAVIGALLLKYRLELIDPNESPDLVCPVDPSTGLLKLTCPTVVIHPAKDIWLKVTKI